MTRNGVRMSELLQSGKSEADETLPSSAEPEDLDSEDDPVTPTPSLKPNKEGSPQVSNSVSETSPVVVVVVDVDDDTQRTECKGDDDDPGADTEPPKSEFDAEEQPNSANHEEMLEIMGAVVPNAKQSSDLTSANESGSNSGGDDDGSASSDSPRLDNPHFLHVRVVPKSGSSHTYTPLSTRGIEIPRQRGQRGNSPLYQVRTAFCFAIREKRWAWRGHKVGVVWAGGNLCVIIDQ